MGKHNAKNREIHEALLLNVVNVLAKERLENRKGAQNQKKNIEKLEERLGKLELENKELRDKCDTQSNVLKENVDKVEDLEQRSRNLELQNKEIQEKNEALSNVLNENTKHIESLKNENKNLNQMLQVQNDNLTNIHEKLQRLEIGDPKKALDDQRKDLKNLKTFAMNVCQLHERLSNPNVRETSHMLIGPT